MECNGCHLVLEEMPIEIMNEYQCPVPTLGLFLAVLDLVDLTQAGSLHGGTQLTKFARDDSETDANELDHHVGELGTDGLFVIESASDLPSVESNAALHLTGFVVGFFQERFTDLGDQT